MVILCLINNYNIFQMFKIAFQMLSPFQKLNRKVLIICTMWNVVSTFRRHHHFVSNLVHCLGIAVSPSVRNIIRKHSFKIVNNCSYLFRFMLFATVTVFILCQIWLNYGEQLYTFIGGNLILNAFSSGLAWIRITNAPIMKV